MLGLESINMERWLSFLYKRTWQREQQPTSGRSYLQLPRGYLDCIALLAHDRQYLQRTGVVPCFKWIAKSDQAENTSMTMQSDQVA